MTASPLQSATSARAPESPRHWRKVVYWLIFVIILASGAVAGRQLADNHLRAMSILARLSNPKAQGFIARFSGQPFTEEMGSALTPQGVLRYRLYIPTGGGHRPGVVLLHGIHKAGIEEPRLVNFGRLLAGAGIEVMTPELKDLADYHVTPGTVDAIGNAVLLLSEKTSEPKVGVLGLSFAGGLALLAAERPVYAPRIGFVAAVGAHDDMTRVARFFAANMIERPDGSSVAFQAHEYGALVLAYAHPEDFFPPRDVATAREALRL